MRAEKGANKCKTNEKRNFSRASDGNEFHLGEDARSFRARSELICEQKKFIVFGGLRWFAMWWMLIGMLVIDFLTSILTKAFLLPPLHNHISGFRPVSRSTVCCAFRCIKSTKNLNFLSAKSGHREGTKIELWDEKKAKTKVDSARRLMFRFFASSKQAFTICGDDRNNKLETQEIKHQDLNKSGFHPGAQKLFAKGLNKSENANALGRRPERFSSLL